MMQRWRNQIFGKPSFTAGGYRRVSRPVVTARLGLHVQPKRDTCACFRDPRGGKTVIQRLSLLMVVLVAVLVGAVSCGTNRRTAPAAERTYLPSPTSTELTKGWSLQFCPAETIDDNVSVEIGRADDDASHRVWRAVNPRTDPILLLPDDLRYADKIWIKLTSENHRNVEACLKYDGNAAQKLQFDESVEESVNRTSSEDCGC